MQMIIDKLIKIGITAAVLLFLVFLIYSSFYDYNKLKTCEKETICQDMFSYPQMIGKLITTTITYRDVDCDKDHDREIQRCIN